MDTLSSKWAVNNWQYIIILQWSPRTLLKLNWTSFLKKQTKNKIGILNFKMKALVLLEAIRLDFCQQ